MAGIDSLTFAYNKEYPVFLNFSWSLAKGDRWSVIGPSGCGKTTLLYLLSGLLTPMKGKVNLDGTASSQSAEKEVKDTSFQGSGGVPQTQKSPKNGGFRGLNKTFQQSPNGAKFSTGLILQDYGLLPWLTAFENVGLGLRIQKQNKENIDRTVKKWLEKLGIEPVADHYPSELSGGQRQRVAIARTLALGPELLLMDEPFASLDALTREELQNLTISLWESLSSTIVLVTHNIEEAVFLGRRVMVLSQPPNIRPLIIENPGSGNPDYRKMPDFVEKCREVRAQIERCAHSGNSPKPGVSVS